MRKYYSCSPIRNGFNFYRSNKITACCFSLSQELEIAEVNDPFLFKIIPAFQMRLIQRHFNKNPPDSCQACINFKLQEWPLKLEKNFSELTLNHFRKCNLNCVHCGYRHNDPNQFDTSHSDVLNAIKTLIGKNVCNPRLHLGVGGGEPSISDGINDILRYALDHEWTADINSNAAVYSPLFAEGVNKNNFILWLTPDAGSRDVYAKIKGSDNFDRAWEVINRYMRETRGKAIVKFIIEDGNKENISEMIATSLRNNVKVVALSLDMNISKSYYPEYKKYILEFINIARKVGLKILLTSFVPPELIQ